MWIYGQCMDNLYLATRATMAHPPPRTSSQHIKTAVPFQVMPAHEIQEMVAIEIS